MSEMFVVASDAPTALHIAGCIFAFLFVSLAVIIVYRLYAHPLSYVPGPRLAAISSLWQARHASRGRIVQLAKTLHRKYGPVVRVGPNEVWFDSKDAFKAIYSTFGQTSPKVPTA
jgi:hypothetical protein